MQDKLRAAVTNIRSRFINRRLSANREAARRALEANQPLWKTLNEYLAKTTSTGGEYSDYLALYSHVRKHRPREILECGTGVSTVILAHALMENERDGGPCGRITSMEDLEQWYVIAQQLLPEHLAPYVDLVLSPRIEDGWYMFRGVRYETVPDRRYDFVFVDGPDFDAPSDGMLTFDFDLIRVVEKADQPVHAIIDDRLSTTFVCQQVFGPDKARYSTQHRLCFVGPVTRHDLLGMDTQKRCFIHSFRYFGNTELKMRMQPRKVAGRGGA
ncbi:MAG: hypothetical protein VW547_00230 [Alphaproteobacteria bacterium]|jgi:predicted O-methyltransferase YrrM